MDPKTLTFSDQPLTVAAPTAPVNKFTFNDKPLLTVDIAAQPAPVQYGADRVDHKIDVQDIDDDRKAWLKQAKFVMAPDKFQRAFDVMTGEAPEQKDDNLFTKIVGGATIGATTVGSAVGAATILAGPEVAVPAATLGAIAGGVGGAVKGAFAKNMNMYFDQNGMPQPLKYGEKPPPGAKIESAFGISQGANAEDDTAFTTLGKSFYNSFVNIGKALPETANLLYGLSTGKSAKFLDEISNTVDAMKLTPSSASGEELVKADAFESVADFMNGQNWNFTPQNFMALAGQTVGSMAQFVGGAQLFRTISAAAKVGQEATIGERLLANAPWKNPKSWALSSAINLSESVAAADHAGLTGRERYALGLVTALGMGALEIGIGGQELRLAGKKAIAKEVAETFATRATKEGATEITAETMEGLYKATLKSGFGYLARMGKTAVKEGFSEASEEMSQELWTESLQQLYDKFTGYKGDGAAGSQGFGTHLFNPESMQQLFINGLGGALGGVLGGAVHLEEQTKSLSKLIFDHVEAGKVDELQKEFKISLNKGTISAQQYAVAQFKVAAYQRYAEETSDLEIKITPSQRREIFELSFQDENAKKAIEDLTADIKTNGSTAIKEAKLKAFNKLSGEYVNKIEKILSTPAKEEDGQPEISTVTPDDAEVATDETVKFPKMRAAGQGSTNKQKTKLPFDTESIDDLEDYIGRTSGAEGQEENVKLAEQALEKLKHDIKTGAKPKEVLYDIIGPLTEVEYSEFIDQGKVSEKRLNSIAEKVKNNQKLSQKETEIFVDKTSEINKIIKKKVDVPVKEDEDSGENEDGSLYKSTTKEKDGLVITNYESFRKSDGRKYSLGGKKLTREAFLSEYEVHEDNLETLENAEGIIIREIRDNKGKLGISVRVKFAQGWGDFELTAKKKSKEDPSASDTFTPEEPGKTDYTIFKNLNKKKAPWTVEKDGAPIASFRTEKEAQEHADKGNRGEELPGKEIPKTDYESIDSEQKGFELKVSAKIKAVYNRLTKRFYYYNSKGKEIRGNKQQASYAKKITPNTVVTWWNELADDIQRDKVREILDNYYAALDKARYENETQSLRLVLMRELAGRKLHPDWKLQVTDVNDRWFSEDGYSLDALVSDHIMGVVHENGFAGLDEQEIVGECLAVIEEFYDGITNADIKYESDKNSMDLYNLESDFFSLSGLDLSEAQEKLNKIIYNEKEQTGSEGTDSGDTEVQQDDAKRGSVEEEPEAEEPEEQEKVTPKGKTTEESMEASKKATLAWWDNFVKIGVKSKEGEEPFHTLGHDPIRIALSVGFDAAIALVKLEKNVRKAVKIAYERIMKEISDTASSVWDSLTPEYQEQIKDSIWDQLMENLSTKEARKEVKRISRVLDRIQYASDEDELAELAESIGMTTEEAIYSAGIRYGDVNRFTQIKKKLRRMIVDEDGNPVIKGYTEKQLFDAIQDFSKAGLVDESDVKGSYAQMPNKELAEHLAKQPKEDLIRMHNFHKSSIISPYYHVIDMGQKGMKTALSNSDNPSNVVKEEFENIYDAHVKENNIAEKYAALLKEYKTRSEALLAKINDLYSNFTIDGKSYPNILAKIRDLNNNIATYGTKEKNQAKKELQELEKIKGDIESKSGLRKAIQHYVNNDLLFMEATTGIPAQMWNAMVDGSKKGMPTYIDHYLSDTKKHLTPLGLFIINPSDTFEKFNNNVSNRKDGRQSQISTVASAVARSITTTGLADSFDDVTGNRTDSYKLLSTLNILTSKISDQAKINPRYAKNPLVQKHRDKPLIKADTDGIKNKELNKGTGLKKLNPRDLQVMMIAHFLHSGEPGLAGSNHFFLFYDQQSDSKNKPLFAVEKMPVSFFTKSQMKGILTDQEAIDEYAYWAKEIRKYVADKLITLPEGQTADDVAKDFVLNYAWNKYWLDDYFRGNESNVTTYRDQTKRKQESNGEQQNLSDNDGIGKYRREAIIQDSDFEGTNFADGQIILMPWFNAKLHKASGNIYGGLVKSTYFKREDDGGNTFIKGNSIVLPDESNEAFYIKYPSLKHLLEWGKTHTVDTVVFSSALKLGDKSKTNPVKYINGHHFDKNSLSSEPIINDKADNEYYLIQQDLVNDGMMKQGEMTSQFLYLIKQLPNAAKIERILANAAHTATKEFKKKFDGLSEKEQKEWYFDRIEDSPRNFPVRQYLTEKDSTLVGSPYRTILDGIFASEVKKKILGIPVFKNVNILINLPGIDLKGAKIVGNKVEHGEIIMPHGSKDQVNIGEWVLTIYVPSDDLHSFGINTVVDHYPEEMKNAVQVNRQHTKIGGKDFDADSAHTISKWKDADGNYETKGWKGMINEVLDLVKKDFEKVENFKRITNPINTKAIDPFIERYKKEEEKLNKNLPSSMVYMFNSNRQSSIVKGMSVDAVKIRSYLAAHGATLKTNFSVPVYVDGKATSGKINLTTFDHPKDVADDISGTMGDNTNQAMDDPKLGNLIAMGKVVATSHIFDIVHSLTREAKQSIVDFMHNPVVQDYIKLYDEMQSSTWKGDKDAWKILAERYNGEPLARNHSFNNPIWSFNDAPQARHLNGTTSENKIATLAYLRFLDYAAKDFQTLRTYINRNEKPIKSFAELRSAQDATFKVENNRLNVIRIVTSEKVALHESNSVQRGNENQALSESHFRNDLLNTAASQSIIQRIKNSFAASIGAYNDKAGLKPRELTQDQLNTFERAFYQYLAVQGLNITESSKELTDNARKILKSLPKDHKVLQFLEVASNDKVQLKKKIGDINNAWRKDEEPAQLKEFQKAFASLTQEQKDMLVKYQVKTFGYTQSRKLGGFLTYMDSKTIAKISKAISGLQPTLNNLSKQQQEDIGDQILLANPDLIPTEKLTEDQGYDLIELANGEGYLPGKYYPKFVKGFDNGKLVIYRRLKPAKGNVNLNGYPLTAYYKKQSALNMEYDKERAYKPVKLSSKIYTMYQGFKNKLDNRKYNYWTLSKSEARDYADNDKNVREQQIDTTDFLVKHTPEFDAIQDEWMAKGNERFDILLNGSKENLDAQSRFFDFVESKGYRGYAEVRSTDQSENAYAVTFNQAKANPESKTPEFDKLPSPSGTPTMTYAGVGSRRTPQPILEKMTEVAKYLESLGYTLNSGGATGADTWFEKGVKKLKNIFLGSKKATPTTEAIAKEIHEKPEALSGYILQLMARNTNQVFGENLDTPVDFVLAWTPNGETKASDRVYYGKDDPRNTGGTGQAIALASLKGIPVINMANEGWREELKKVLAKKPSEKKETESPITTQRFANNKSTTVLYKSATRTEERTWTNVETDKSNPNLLHAFDSLRNEMRTFNINNIIKVVSEEKNDGTTLNYQRQSSEPLASTDPVLQEKIRKHLHKMFPGVVAFSNEIAFQEYVDTLAPGQILDTEALGAEIGNAYWINPQSAVQSTEIHEFVHKYWDLLPDNDPTKLMLLKLFGSRENAIAAMKESPNITEGKAIDESIVSDIGKEVFRQAQIRMGSIKWNKFKEWMRKFWVNVKQSLWGNLTKEEYVSIMADNFWKNKHQLDLTATRNNLMNYMKGDRGSEGFYVLQEELNELMKKMKLTRLSDIVGKDIRKIRQDIIEVLKGENLIYKMMEKRFPNQFTMADETEPAKEEGEDASTKKRLVPLTINAYVMEYTGQNKRDFDWFVANGNQDNINNLKISYQDYKEEMAELQKIIDEHANWQSIDAMNNNDFQLLSQRLEGMEHVQKVNDKAHQVLSELLSESYVDFVAAQEISLRESSPDHNLNKPWTKAVYEMVRQHESGEQIRDWSKMRTILSGSFGSQVAPFFSPMSFRETPLQALQHIRTRGQLEVKRNIDVHIPALRKAIDAVRKKGLNINDLIYQKSGVRYFKENYSSADPTLVAFMEMFIALQQEYSGIAPQDGAFWAVPEVLMDWPELIKKYGSSEALFVKLTSENKFDNLHIDFNGKVMTLKKARKQIESNRMKGVFGALKAANVTNKLISQARELYENKSNVIDKAGFVIFRENEHKMAIGASFNKTRYTTENTEAALVKYFHQQIFKSVFERQKMLMKGVEIYYGKDNKTMIAEYVKQMNEYFLYNINPESKLGHKGDMILEWFNTWTVWKFLGFNLVGGGFNLTAGLTQNLRELGLVKTMKGIARFRHGLGLNKDFEKGFIDNDIVRFMNKFGIVNISRDMEISPGAALAEKVKRVVFSPIAYTEYINHGVTIAGLMSDEEWNEYLLSVKENRELAISNDVIQRYIDTSERIHGAYNPINKRPINRTTMGRMLMALKNWMPDVFLAHFESEYTDMHDVVRKGIVTSAASKDMLEIYKSVFTSPGSVKDKWNALSEIDKQNMGKMMREATMMGLMFLLMAAVRDDKDKVKRISRIIGDVGFVYDMNNWEFLLSSPVPAFKTAYDGIEFFKHLGKTVTGQGETYTTGPWAGYAKAQVLVLNSLPANRIVKDLFEPSK